MKTLMSVVLLLAVAASTTFAADSFEGRIKMRMTSGEQSNDINYAVKGSKLRIEMESKKGSAASILDIKAQEMLILMPEQKSYMVMPLKDSAVADRAAAEAHGTSLEKTNITETILGYKTTKYLAKNKDQKEPTEIWATEGLGFFFNPNDLGPGAKNRTPAPWEKEMRDKGFFPLRTIVKDKRGHETKMEVVGLEKASLPDSLFTPPSDYKKFTMPSLGNLIPGFGGKN